MYYVVSIALLCYVVSISSAFQPPVPSSIIIRQPPSNNNNDNNIKLHYSLKSSIDIAESAPRQIEPLTSWASNYGVQISDCYQLNSDDGLDIYASTNQYLPMGSQILGIPNELILTGNKALEELGSGVSYQAEQTINPDDLSTFYLFLKVLKEYDLGEDSIWHSWLDSLPRYFSNGASLTDFCFGCLPPYAAELALQEKLRLGKFVNALNGVSFLSEESIDATKFVYNVVFTRMMPMPNGDYCIAPMCDYFNHWGDQTDASISFDEEGNCFAHATRDVQAGEPLRICYDNPTNPSLLLAKYGFLDESSPATFCKYVISNPTEELFNMGYPDRAVIYKDGSISNEVWDILLYEELGKVSPEDQYAFYQAYMSGDEGTKQSYHEAGDNFVNIHSKLQQHVNFLINELDELGLGLEIQVAQGQDSKLHPRLPLIMRHNQFSPEDQQAFYHACMTGDEVTKQSYHEAGDNFVNIHSKLKKHVDYLVNELDELSENKWQKDIKRHPRLPLLMRHNEYIRDGFEKVQQTLDNNMIC